MNIQTYYSKQVSDVVWVMLDEGHISEKNLSYLLVDQPKAGRYFLLPKIHKSGNTGRPFVSSNGHLAEKISVFCSASPAPCPESTVLFTRQHRFLREQDALGPIPYWNPLNVTSLYTNKPHQACEKVWELRVNKNPQTLVKLLTLVLKRNHFKFNGKHYLQVQGAAVGTKKGPRLCKYIHGAARKTGSHVCH